MHISYGYSCPGGHPAWIHHTDMIIPDGYRTWTSQMGIPNGYSRWISHKSMDLHWIFHIGGILQVDEDSPDGYPYPRWIYQLDLIPHMHIPDDVSSIWDIHIPNGGCTIMQHRAYLPTPCCSCCVAGHLGSLTYVRPTKIIQKLIELPTRASTSRQCRVSQSEEMKFKTWISTFRIHERTNREPRENDLQATGAIMTDYAEDNVPVLVRAVTRFSGTPSKARDWHQRFQAI